MAREKAAPKTVRLRNAAGVVVTTSEENATRLSGFEPVEAKSAPSKSTK